MANNLRDLRRKMKAIKSTRQVTKAMELVAASKMRRAVQNAQLLKRYALRAWNLLQKISRSGRTHPFLVETEFKKALVIVFTSDRGLAGALNAHILRATARYVQAMKNEKDVQLEFVGVGRKGQQFLARTGQNMVAAFPAFSNHTKFKDIRPVSKIAMDGFLDGTYDHVILVYSNFISALVQEPTVKVLLPFTQSGLMTMIQEMFPPRSAGMEDLSQQVENVDYVFEPSGEETLNRILPQLIELQIYQAVLESAASEHSARMVAMKNASENASDILDDLTLTYNRTRQSIITSELAELSASKAALDPS